MSTVIFTKTFRVPVVNYDIVDVTVSYEVDETDAPDHDPVTWASEVAVEKALTKISGRVISGWEVDEFDSDGIHVIDSDEE